MDFVLIKYGIFILYILILIIGYCFIVWYLNEFFLLLFIGWFVVIDVICFLNCCFCML